MKPDARHVCAFERYGNDDYVSKGEEYTYLTMLAAEHPEDSITRDAGGLISQQGLHSGRNLLGVALAQAPRIED